MILELWMIDTLPANDANAITFNEDTFEIEIDSKCDDSAGIYDVMLRVKDLEE